MLTVLHHCILFNPFYRKTLGATQGTIYATTKNFVDPPVCLVARATRVDLLSCTKFERNKHDKIIVN